MTKKFIHTDKKLNGKNSKNEFLIPDIFQKQNRLIGLNSGQVYEYGLVVYTGVDLDENKIFEKLPNFESIDNSAQQYYKSIFKNYLTQIKDLKIGKIVMLATDLKLTTIEQTNS